MAMGRRVQWLAALGAVALLGWAGQLGEEEDFSRHLQGDGAAFASPSAERAGCLAPSQKSGAQLQVSC